MKRDLDKLAAYYADAPDDISLADVDLESVPRHVSIIMDGNGRWAQARGLDRSEGHVAGVDSLRETVTTSVRLGVDALSVYAFSTENWKRPQREVNLLMHLFATTLLKELPLFHQENVRLRFLGDLTQLPDETRAVFQEGLDETADHDGMTFALRRMWPQARCLPTTWTMSSSRPGSTRRACPTPTCSSGRRAS